VILPVRLRVPALGNLEVVGELELPDSILGTAPAADLDDAGLAARLGCSRRTVARLRAERRIPSIEVRPGLHRFKLADVEAFEAANRREAVPSRPRGRRPKTATP
jgi:excisionase family DNA binding protein